MIFQDIKDTHIKKQERTFFFQVKKPKKVIGTPLPLP